MQNITAHYNRMHINAEQGSVAHTHYYAIWRALRKYRDPRLAISDMRFRCYLAEDPCKCYYQEAISKLEEK